MKNMKFVVSVLFLSGGLEVLGSQDSKANGETV